MFVSLVRDKHSFVLNLYSLFLYFVNLPCVFCENYSHRKVRTRVRLIWGNDAFIEKNFTPVFLFIIYDIYVATASSLIKLSFVSVLKDLQHIPKFNSSLKNLPLLGDFPLLFIRALNIRTQNWKNFDLVLSL